MITFDQGDIRFNYRVVGVALHENHVLLHNDVVDDFWALPGGRAELKEAAAQTVSREMVEELGAPVTVERLIWVVEDHYNYRNKNYHEIALYFLIHLEPKSPFLDLSKTYPGLEENVDLTFQWFDLDKLDSIKLYPSFLPERLKKIPLGVDHIFHDTGDIRVMHKDK